LRYFYSSSELESSLESASSWFSPIFSAKVGGGGAKVSFNAGTGREVGKIVLKSRSDLTSLEYFSDFSALVNIVIVDMFCILGSVSVLAICIVPSVLFRINPFGKDVSFINEPFTRKYP